jgi:hypothetical protein
MRAIVAWDANFSGHLLSQYLQSTCRETQQSGAGNQLIELISRGKWWILKAMLCQSWWLKPLLVPEVK